MELENKIREKEMEYQNQIENLKQKLE